MICAEFERIEGGYRVDAEYQGYGNANIFEAFKIEGIDLKKTLDNMKIGETKVYNIGWWNGCGIAKQGIRTEGCMMDKEKWRIVDNYHENILKDYFETEKEAEDFVMELIKGHKERKESYDYNVDRIVTRMRYYEYMESIED